MRVPARCPGYRKVEACLAQCAQMWKEAWGGELSNGAADPVGAEQRDIQLCLGGQPSHLAEGRRLNGVLTPG